MIGEMTCPDCGGIVGATEVTEAGPPCRCFADSPSMSSSGTMSGTMTGTMAGTMHGSGTGSSDGVSVGEPPPPPTVVIKACRLCGKDLTGQKRFKDVHGYYCVPCNDEEKLRLNQGRVPCKVCGKLVRPENLTDYEGTAMCPKCHEERIESRKEQMKRIGFKGARSRDELQQINTILVALAALAVIIAVGLLIHHFH